MKHSIGEKNQAACQRIKEKVPSLLALIVAFAGLMSSLLGYYYREDICTYLLEHRVRNTAIKLSDVLWSGNEEAIRKTLQDPELDSMKIRLIDKTGKDLLDPEKRRVAFLSKYGEEELNELYEKQRQRTGRMPEYRSSRTDEKNNKINYLTCFDFVTGQEGKSYLLLVSLAITPSPQSMMLYKILLSGTFALTILTAASAAGFVYLENRRVARNVHEGIKKISKGHAYVNIKEEGFAEIQKVIKALNALVKQMEDEKKLHREAVANISHDLRTPLTMMVGYGEVMRDIPGENNAENIQVILDEAARMSTLVNDILDLSRYETKQQPMEPKLFCLTDMIISIVQRCDKLVERFGMEVKFEGDCRVWVKGDKLKISRVLYNLLNNSYNHLGKDGKIIISQLVKDDQVKISVSDNGEGISPEKLAHIWDRYYRAGHVSDRPRMKGSGLGLCIVKEIFQEHKIPFGAESKVGEGSTFWFVMDVLDREYFDDEE